MKTRLLILLLGAAFLILGCSKDDDTTEPSTTEKEWTIIGYFNGNNNLDHTQAGTSYIIGDVQEMEHAGGTANVNSIVMLS